MARKDDVTMELPGIKKRPGRPRTGKAKSDAARAKAYRQRKAAKEAERVQALAWISVQLDQAVADLGKSASFELVWGGKSISVTVTEKNNPMPASGNSLNG